MHRCGGLNENGLYRCSCLNTWPLVGGIVWEELGGYSFIKGGVSLGGGVDFKVSEALPVCSFSASCLWLKM